jgi:hypothetical protein
MQSDRSCNKRRISEWHTNNIKAYGDDDDDDDDEGGIL